MPSTASPQLAAPDSIVIDARNLTLSLGRPPAQTDILRGIDLSVTAGDSVALLGPSGSGKSSLMAVLSGMERPSGGSARIAGLDFERLDENALAIARRVRIGVILQAFHLLPTMTALENVAVPLELAGERDAFARAEAELSAVGLGHRIGHYPAQLSGGEQQRVAIARALAPRMDLLFARQAEAGATLFVITHDPSLAARCRRVIELADGRIVADSQTA